MIYFVQFGSDGPIKIGMTTGNTLATVYTHIKSLQTASPYGLHLIAVMPGKAGTEQKIHKKFSSTRLQGEWFLSDETLLTFIRSEAIIADAISATERRCSICDAPFIPDGETSRYCSDRCREKRRCVCCGKAFTPIKIAWKSYCSPECYWKDART